MEASGTPTPPPEPQPRQTPPPPPPPGAAPADEQAGGGWRALAVVLALALAFACAVMIIAMVGIGDSPRCNDPAGIEAERQENPNDLTIDCFDGSSAQKALTLILGWPSGILAGIAALVALFFAATGRHGRLLLQLTGASIVLGVLSILIGSI
jgi:hypothetical protein